MPMPPLYLSRVELFTSVERGMQGESLIFMQGNKDGNFR